MAGYRYVILERTSFPGVYTPLARCFLQSGELATGMNRRHYHERARPLGALLTYIAQDAQRIIEYRRQGAPYADHLLFLIPDADPLDIPRN